VLPANVKPVIIVAMTTLVPGSAVPGRSDHPTPFHPRRVRVAEGVYQRVDRRTGRPVEGKFEFTYRDATGRQVWQTAKGTTRAAAKAERAEMFARLHRGDRVERTNMTVGEVGRLWLERGTGVRGPWSESTRKCYVEVVRRTIQSSPDPARRPLGERRLRDLTIDNIAAWSRANERAFAPTTARLALNTLNRVFRFAVRRGWIASNPVAKLEPGEKPPWTPRPAGILEPAQLACVLSHSGSMRPLFELMAYTGLRIGEARGLRWSDVDVEAGLLRVHRQLDLSGLPRRVKTPAARREIVLAASVIELLTLHRLRSTYRNPDDLVFCNRQGRGLDYRKVAMRFQAAVEEAGIRRPGRLSLHSLRHGYASLLIASGLDVVFVACQLGHANPATTLSIYAHTFARADHAQAAAEALQASYESMRRPLGR
jgi:integrase